MTPTNDFRIDLFLPSYDLTSRALRIAEVAGIARQAEELGYDGAWYADHFFADYHTPAGRNECWDPFVLLATVGAATERLNLGVLAICNAFRTPGFLAREALSLADVVGEDRQVILCMGCGWNDEEFDAFGYPFDHLVGRLQETLHVLPGLLRQEVVDYQGKYVTLNGAQVRHHARAPEVWVAAVQPRMQRLTAEHAVGWNYAWHGPDVGDFNDKLDRLLATQSETGRAAVDVRKTAGLLVMPVEGREREWVSRSVERLTPRNRDGEVPFWWASPIEERVVTGSAAQITEKLIEYKELGLDNLILTFGPTPAIQWDPNYMERVATVLGAVRGA